jgi:hypothetical protein
MFLSSFTLCNTSSFLTRSVQLIFSILLQHHISKLSKYFWSNLPNMLQYNFMRLFTERCFEREIFVCVWARASVRACLCVFVTEFRKWKAFYKSIDMPAECEADTPRHGVYTDRTVWQITLHPITSWGQFLHLQLQQCVLWLVIYRHYSPNAITYIWISRKQNSVLRGVRERLM